MEHLPITDEEEKPVLYMLPVGRDHDRKVAGLGKTFLQAASSLFLTTGNGDLFAIWVYRCQKCHKISISNGTPGEEGPDECNRKSCRN